MINLERATFSFIIMPEDKILSLAALNPEVCVQHIQANSGVAEPNDLPRASSPCTAAYLVGAG